MSFCPNSEKVVIEEVAPLVFASTRYACGIEQDKFAVPSSPSFFFVFIRSLCKAHMPSCHHVGRVVPNQAGAGGPRREREGADLPLLALQSSLTDDHLSEAIRSDPYRSREVLNIFTIMFA